MAAAPAVIDAGALRAHVFAEPFALGFDGPGRQASLVQSDALGFRSLGLWARATRVISERRIGQDYEARLQTTDPLGRALLLTVRPAGSGVIAVHARVDGATAGVDAMSASFAAFPGERFLGFGERSNSVDQRGNDVENYVAEGPYQPIENLPIVAFVPLPGWRPGPTATYYPVPWLLSTRGYGVSIDQDETSTFRLGTPTAWGVDVAAPHLDVRVYAGPQPADALRRYTAAVGRQPRPSTPAVFGPWWQPSGDEKANASTLRAARAPSSVVQTYTHYLPCGAQLANRQGQRDRTQRMHAEGLAVTTYFNPMICATYSAAYGRAAAGGWLTRDPSGQPYLYRYTGSSTFLVGQVDFSAPGAWRFYGDLLDEAVSDGYDGWMEDFGEYTPSDARAADGSTGEGGHNRYVAGYHAAARDYSRDRAPRPLLRFNRSGWRETAKDSEIVWGGDPSTGWDFDGLASALRNGLTMGLSGVSLWGSDIGGFFALSLPQTTPELLIRWIQVGFVSGVMRTQANGFELAPSPRAQIFDKGVLPIWARYARLRTQLYPYLAAAQAEYQRTGMPIMRALALAYPDDAAGAGRDDEEMFGPDLLAAPVMSPGQTRRALHLPPGRWVDLWRSVVLDRVGAPRPVRPVVLSGGRGVTLPAPLEEVPLLARAGAILPLLPADVWTLSTYGKGRVVRLADRATRRVLLAFPRGTSRAGLGASKEESAVSSEGRTGWTLRLHARKAVTYVLRASLATLRRPFVPCGITVGGRRLAGSDWEYSRSTAALTARFRVKNGRVNVLRKGCVA